LKIFLVFIILIISNSVFGQIHLADSLSNVGNNLIEYRKYDSAKTILKQALKLNQTANRAKESARDCNDIGTAFHWKREYDSALFYYQKANDILENVDDKDIKPLILSNLASLFKKKGQYDKALEQSLKALEFSPNKTTRISTYNTIGSLYSKIEEFDKSIFYYKKALEESKSGDSTILSILYNNLGNLFNKLKQSDSTIFYLKKSLIIKKDLGSKSGISKTLNNIGLAYLDQEKYDLAQGHLDESLLLKSKLKDSLGMANTLNLLAKIHLKKGEEEHAYLKLKEAHNILRNSDDLYALKENLWLQAEYFRIAENGIKEADILKSYIKLNDQLLNSDKAKALAEMQSKYDSDKKDEEIAYLEHIDALQKADLAFQKRINSIYLIGAVVLFTILCFLFILLRINRIKKQQIEALHDEMQHRIKNNLQLLSGILKLQHNKIDDEEAFAVLKTSESRVNSMALVHHLLFKSHQKREIAVKDYLQEMCKFLKTSFSNPERDIIITPTSDDLMIDVDKMISIGLIINELITNSIKHAFKQTENPRIEIRFYQLESRNYFMEVSDNGVGIETFDPNHTESFGMKMIHMICKQINAEMTRFTRNGTVFQFSIPSL